MAIDPIGPITQELFRGLNDWDHVVRVVIRLTAAIVLGGVLGFERQREGKTAGMRTHMLVALGSSLFVVVPLEAGMVLSDLSRVIQGVATGIGFLGAGTILKLSEKQRIEGLTSAASIWLTAAVGMAVGSGWLWPAILAIVFGWLILGAFHKMEKWLRRKFPTRMIPPSSHDIDLSERA